MHVKTGFAFIVDGNVADRAQLVKLGGFASEFGTMAWLIGWGQ